MKFRAERDILLDGLATAARAAATRGGALPALSGVRLEVKGDVLHLAGSDLDLTVQVEVPVGGITDGVCVIPARLGTDIVRASSRAPSPSPWKAARPRSPPAAASSPCGCCRPRSSCACPSRPETQ